MIFKKLLIWVYQYIRSLFIAIDQLAGSIAAFGAQWTISAVCGRNMHKSFWWFITVAIIDFTFYPIDGSNHCSRAHKTEHEDEYKHGSWLILFIITFVACFILAPLFWSYHGIKLLIKRFKND